MSFFRRFLRWRERLWFIPLTCVLAGVAMSFGTIAIDQAYNYKLVPRSISGGPDAAIEGLGTIAASMVSLAALVLTITTPRRGNDLHVFELLFLYGRGPTPALMKRGVKTLLQVDFDRRLLAMSSGRVSAAGFIRLPGALS